MNVMVDLLHRLRRAVEREFRRAVLAEALFIAELPTGSESAKEGLVNPDGVANGVARHRSVLSIWKPSPEHVLVQHIEVPEEVARTLDSMLPIHLRRWSPFDTTRFAVAAMVVGPSGHGKMRVELRYADLRELTSKRTGTSQKCDAVLIGDDLDWLSFQDPATVGSLRRRWTTGIVLSVSAMLLCSAVLWSLSGRLAQSLTSTASATAILSRTLVEDRMLREQLAILRAAEAAARERSASPPDVSPFLDGISAKVSAETKLISVEWAGHEATLRLHAKSMELLTELAPAGWIVVDYEKEQGDGASTGYVVHLQRTAP